MTAQSFLQNHGFPIIGFADQHHGWHAVRWRVLDHCFDLFKHSIASIVREPFRGVQPMNLFVP
ncbi:hypothetical protein AUQ41_01630 [Thalassospira sp. MCCC 1A02898]|nr:hypothetical protein AUQ41_01630 [Thalassospira sp. MCCC 1A02898]